MYITQLSERKINRASRIRKDRGKKDKLDMKI